MKKIKTIFAIMMIATVAMIMSGCTGLENSKTTVTMNKNGSGTTSIKIPVQKNISDTSAGDLDTKIKAIKAALPVKLGATVTKDTTSSNSDNFIIVSFSYKSVEDYNNKIDVLNNIELADNEDSEELTSENDYGVSEDMQEQISNKIRDSYIKGVMEYLKKNDIYADESSRAYMHLVQGIFIKPMTFDDLEDEFEENTDDFNFDEFEENDSEGEEFYDEEYLGDYSEEELPSAVINNNTLKLHISAITALFNQMTVILEDTNTLDNKDYSTLINTALEKSIIDAVDEVLSENKIADKLKTKLGINDENDYVLENLEEEEIKEIVNSSLGDKINEIYPEKLLSDFFGVDLNSETDPADNIKFTLNFEGVSKTYSYNELFEKTDDNGYITISANGASVSDNNKNSSNSNLDNTPATSDNFKPALVFGVFVLSAICVVILYKRQKHTV